MDRVFLGDTHGLQVGHQRWRAIADTINWVCEHWDQPDEGIWDVLASGRDISAGRRPWMSAVMGPGTGANTAKASLAFAAGGLVDDD